MAAAASETTTTTTTTYVHQMDMRTLANEARRMAANVVGIIARGPDGANKQYTTRCKTSTNIYLRPDQSLKVAHVTLMKDQSEIAAARSDLPASFRTMFEIPTDGVVPGLSDPDVFPRDCWCDKMGKRYTHPRAVEMLHPDAESQTGVSNAMSSTLDAAVRASLNGIKGSLFPLAVGYRAGSKYPLELAVGGLMAASGDGANVKILAQYISKLVYHTRENPQAVFRGTIYIRCISIGRFSFEKRNDFASRTRSGYLRLPVRVYYGIEWDEDIMPMIAQLQQMSLRPEVNPGELKAISTLHGEHQDADERKIESLAVYEHEPEDEDDTAARNKRPRGEAAAASEEAFA